jgi:hypothetical protein|tara:strand:+ start:5889 stop:6227 length:339 start_codon:yes stop_codon:yes gene_type:complete
MSNKFYESEQVKEEIKGMETLYTELARLSIQFPSMSDELKREHLEKTMMLIAKQKVFYARLCLMAVESEEAKIIKTQLDKMSQVYSQGRTIQDVLGEMEDKLRVFKKQLDEA